MDLLAQAADGFHSLTDIDPAARESALKHLTAWLTEAEFAPYRPQLEWLIQTKQWAGLVDRFYQILPFGTGGRRGPVGVGPNRMNLWTLGASVQGHCEYLKEKFPGLEPLRVVLAYDVRRFEDKRRNYNPDLPNPALHLSSRDFANHAAGVYVANGIQATILPADSPRYLATPELSYTIRYLRAHGGLNISASHNPPDDNGGKFYDERGGQPVPPDDQIMADLVDQVTAIKFLPWADAVRGGKVLWLDDAPHQAYIELCARQGLLPPPKFDEIKVVYTPLHGVGSMTAMEALLKHGFHVIPVEEQMKPDGQFPNVTKAPNPEVPESMDRAERTAQANAADLVMATDPDADRIGGMIPNTTDADPRRYAEAVKAKWRFVTGNEIAVLLTHYKLNQLTRQGRMPRSPVVIKTDVTTGLITRVARHFGAQIVENLLVGFKYVADVLWHLEQNGSYEDVQGTPQDFIIAGEESHGILVTPQIRDKDAGGAAVVMAEMALDQKRQGRTVLAYLEAIYREFGYFRNEVVPLVMTGIRGKQDMTRMLDELRMRPPREIGGVSVTGFEDLRDENGRMGPIKGETDRASRNVLIFHLGDRGRITLRPSGTEPKAKAYLEVSAPPCPAGTTDAEWQRMRGAVDQLTQRWAEEFVRECLKR
jgi:phosphoglucomutase/phosphomannomutase